jgi:hypothetical protein
MRYSSRTIILLLIFVTFLASIGTRSCNLDWLAHDVDHGSQATIAASSHDHSPLPYTKGGSDQKPMSDMEHQLLHAVSDGHLFMGMAIKLAWVPSAQTMLTLSSSPVLPLAALDPPFRPPQATTLI